MTAEHQPIVWGPVRAGEQDISGEPYYLSGYGWSCSCGASVQGYANEDEAGDGVERHLQAVVA